MATQFETFREMLLTALQDATFVRNNTILQNATLRAGLVSRINSLSADQNLVLDVSHVSSVSGGIEANPAENAIDFQPDGYEVALSAGNNAVISPNRLWRRTALDGLADPADGVRYLLADTTRGVLKLGADLTVRGIFPGMGAQAALGYNAPTSVLTFTVGVMEYIAIAMSNHHIVRIYEYVSGALVHTIGTLDTTGATGLLLNSPVDIAYDTSSSYLYVLSQLGQPAGATAATGFISRYDCSVPPIINFVDIYASSQTNGSVLRGEITAATAIFCESGKLWIANGVPAEIGCIDTTTDLCTLYLGPSAFSGYVLSSLGSLRVKTVGADRYLYAVVGTRVLVISLQTNAIVRTFSFANQTAQLVNDGAYGSVVCAEPDTLVVDDVSVDRIITCDLTNQTVVRVDEQVYGSSSVCLFSAQQFSVPIRLVGYALAGTIAPDLVTVEYLSAASGVPWRRLDQVTDVSPSTYFAIRLTVRIPMGYPLGSGSIRRLTVLGSQA
jgi:hypothetical protein